MSISCDCPARLLTAGANHRNQQLVAPDGRASCASAATVFSDCFLLTRLSTEWASIMSISCECPQKWLSVRVDHSRQQQRQLVVESAGWARIMSISRTAFSDYSRFVYIETFSSTLSTEWASIMSISCDCPARLLTAGTRHRNQQLVAESIGWARIMCISCNCLQ